MRPLVHSLLVAAAVSAAAVSADPQPCPPITSPQDGTAPIWSVWDGTATPPHVTRQHVRLDTLRADGQLPVSAPGWAMLLELGAAYPVVDHVLYEVGDQAWAPPVIGAEVGGTHREDVGCVRASQPHGWRAWERIAAALASMRASAERLCAATIVAGHLSGQTDHAYLCAAAQGVRERIASGETLEPPPSDLDYGAWCRTWQEDCQGPNSRNEGRLVALIQAAIAASQAAGGALPEVPPDYLSGWTHVPEDLGQ